MLRGDVDDRSAGRLRLLDRIREFADATPRRKRMDLKSLPSFHRALAHNYCEELGLGGWVGASVGSGGGRDALLSPPQCVEVEVTERERWELEASPQFASSYVSVRCFVQGTNRREMATTATLL